MKTEVNNHWKKDIGNLGEQLVASFLSDQGCSILELNYLKKWGELDVIAQKNQTIHFIEVKSVSYETMEQLKSAVSYETWRPEDKVDLKKQQRLKRTINTWLFERKWTGDWQIDIIVMRIVPRETFSTIKIMENVIFE